MSAIQNVVSTLKAHPYYAVVGVGAGIYIIMRMQSPATPVAVPMAQAQGYAGPSDAVLQARASVASAGIAARAQTTAAALASRTQLGLANIAAMINASNNATSITETNSAADVQKQSLTNQLNADNISGALGNVALSVQLQEFMAQLAKTGTTPTVPLPTTPPPVATPTLHIPAWAEVQNIWIKNDGGSGVYTSYANSVRQDPSRAPTSWWY